MLGGHLPELLIVLILALVVFGPKRLPEIGGAVGKGIREFKKGTQDLADRTSLTDTPSPEVHSTTAREAEVDRPGAVPVQPHDREAS